MDSPLRPIPSNRPTRPVAPRRDRHRRGDERAFEQELEESSGDEHKPDTGEPEPSKREVPKPKAEDGEAGSTLDVVG